MCVPILQPPDILEVCRCRPQQQPLQYCATTVSLSSSNSHDDDDDDDDDDSSTSHGSDDGEHHIIDIDNDATTVVSFIDNHHPSSTVQQRKQAHQHRLQTVHARIHILFYYLFIPVMIVFIAMSMGHHFLSHHHDKLDDSGNNNNLCWVAEPNVSPMIPLSQPTILSCSHPTKNSTSGMNMDMNMGGGTGFMLMPNIPGLGMYFHFGLVLLLFIYDGIQRTVPTYTPSLFLATVSTYHLAVLLSVDVLWWDVLQTQFYTTVSLTNMEIVQRIIQFVWSLVSGCLAYSLHQFWNLRVTALRE